MGVWAVHITVVIRVTIHRTWVNSYRPLIYVRCCVFGISVVRLLRSVRSAWRHQVTFRVISGTGKLVMVIALVNVSLCLKVVRWISVGAVWSIIPGTFFLGIVIGLLGVENFCSRGVALGLKLRVLPRYPFSSLYFCRSLIQRTNVLEPFTLRWIPSFWK